MVVGRRSAAYDFFAADGGVGDGVHGRVNDGEGASSSDKNVLL